MARLLDTHGRKRWVGGCMGGQEIGSDHEKGPLPTPLPPVPREDIEEEEEEEGPLPPMG